MTSPRYHSRAFTLIELLAAMAILALLMTIAFGVFGQASKAWSLSEQRTETFQGARVAMEMISRELECAIAASASPNGDPTRQITFLAYEDDAAIHGAVTGVSATPPNDSIFFVGTSSMFTNNLDLAERGYFVAYSATNAYGMRARQFYLCRHATYSHQRSANYDLFDPSTTTTWPNTPILSVTNKLPLVDNVLRFELRYEYLTNSTAIGTSARDDWPSTTILPRAVHIRLSVLDRRAGERLASLLPTSGLSSADLDKVPFDIDNMSVNEAIKGLLRNNLRTFYRTVHLKNSQ